MAIEDRPNTAITRAEYEASADRLAELSRLAVRSVALPGELSLEDGAKIYTDHYIAHSDMRSARERQLGNG